MTREPVTLCWLGNNSALLEAATQQYDVVHVRSARALLQTVGSYRAPCVVIDCCFPDIEAGALIAPVREAAPAARIVALVGEPGNGADLLVDGALAVTASPAEFRQLVTHLCSTTNHVGTGFDARGAERPARVLERRLAHLEGLLQSALNVPGSIEESSILADLRQVAHVAVDADDVAVLLTDQGHNDISDTLRLGVPEAYLEECRSIFASLPPDQRTAYLGDEILLRTVTAKQPSSVAAREARGAAAQSYLRLPLIIDNQLVGFIGLFSHTPGRFDGSHLQMGRLFAAQVATAVRNLGLYFRLNRAEQRQQAVGEVARLITEDLALDRVLTRIVAEAVRLLEADAGAVALVQPDRSLVVSAVNDPYSIPQGYRFEPGEGLAGMVALSGQPMVVPDYAHWEHAVPELGDRLPPGATLFGVPLNYQGRVLGVLLVMALRMGPGEVIEAQETLRLLAPQAATAIGNSQLHETVRQERQQLRAILDHTAAGVMVCDGDGRVLLVNPEAQRVLNRLGLAYEAIQGRRVPDLLRELLPDQGIEPGDWGHVIELDLGPVGEYLLHIAQIATPDGAVERYVAVAQDISQLRRLDRMKSDLIHILSHDLRNPLGLARGSIDLLDEPDLDADQREQLTGMIVSSLERMEQLIQDVTDLEMAESLGHETAQPYQLPALVQRIVARNTPKAERQGLALAYEEVRVPPQHLTGHAILVGQAIDNLVGNAIKYTPAGGYVHVSLSVDGDFAVIRVSDDGIGIPEESLPFIFDQFYRVHNEQTRNIPGTGLGLSLVQTIARTHGGWVTVRSQAGIGSEFVLALPVSQRLHPPATASRSRRIDLSGLVKSPGG